MLEESAHAFLQKPSIVYFHIYEVNELCGRITSDSSHIQNSCAFLKVQAFLQGISDRNPTKISS